MPRFTIVIPVKTGGVYLKKAVESVLSQTFADFELIILGDTVTAAGSDPVLISKYQDPRIKFLLEDKELNMLENWARITALHKGEFLTILGYDDILYPTYLETIDRLINEDPAASVYQCGFHFINAQDQFCESGFALPANTNQKELLGKLLKNDLFIMATGYMMRSKDYDLIGGIPTSYPNLLYADFELWLKLTGLSHLAFSPSIQFAFRLHESTTVRTKENEQLKAFEQLGNYFSTLSSDAELARVLNENGQSFLLYHCNAIMYRLLKRQLSQRNGLSVKQIAAKFLEIASAWKLSGFDYTAHRSIQNAIFIDKNIVTRLLFYWYKKIFPASGLVSRDWQNGVVSSSAVTSSGVVHSSNAVTSSEVVHSSSASSPGLPAGSASPLISICIPAYNRPDYLKRLLDSIAIQRFRNFEVIVTDDSSNSEVANFIERSSYSFVIHYVKNETPKGTPQNWMEGIKYAKAPWIKIIHDDDWFANEHSLEKFAAATNSGASVIFSGYNAVYEQNERVVDKTISLEQFEKIKKDPYRLFSSNLIGPPSVVLFKKEISTLYDSNLKWLVDLEGYVRMIKTHAVKYISQPLVNMSYNTTQVTNDCFRNPAVEISEALYYFEIHGENVYKSWVSYDGWWRLLRNLSIRNEEELNLYAAGKPVPAFLKNMLRFQRHLPLSLLKFGPASKLLMFISYLINR